MKVALAALALTAAGGAMFAQFRGWERQSQQASSALSQGVPEFRGELPRSGGVAAYAGSASCMECHPKQHASWHRTHHRTMTQIVGTNSVVADFNHVTLEWLANRFTLERRGDEFWVAIEDLDELAEARRNHAPPPAPARVQLRLATGSHHMQVFWLPVPAGNAQVGFPFTWLIE
ncbi:MAG: hypothetical protein HYZ36_08880, partial [Pedosphaera parvula]|nr:hypothetical protein [Pedosphaera parvula]